MEDLDNQYKNYWETTMFFQNQELEFDSWPLEEAFSGSGDSSSPGGAAMPCSFGCRGFRRQHRRRRLRQRRMVVVRFADADSAADCCSFRSRRKLTLTPTPTHEVDLELFV
ncbi:hypothetical protein F2Q70_00013648 [Brassica cretica]|uniref:Uncharacterized protein n=1 Tax=Brassica cretica TaxID=69181 RepID=A0A8S9J4A2_BRACR|nr:hypothetical protein F2Q68_00006676 [Brassica cretica]KAF2612251.1 hypothetical protein F2Q70_00013648 [Brassica cretica]